MPQRMADLVALLKNLGALALRGLAMEASAWDAAPSEPRRGEH